MQKHEIFSIRVYSKGKLSYECPIKFESKEIEKLKEQNLFNENNCFEINLDLGRIVQIK